MNLETVPLADLHEHPFQQHIPDMVGTEWKDFLEDVRARGVQDPLRVSNRTGLWVVVDGHQRLRAAKKSGYTHLVVLPQAFADEGEEVDYIAGSFQHHRTATVAQRVTVGRAKEAFHAIGAKVGRPKPPILREATEARVSIRNRLIMASEGWLDPWSGKIYADDDSWLFGEDEEELTSIEVNLKDHHKNQSSSKAAEAVGLSRATYERGKKIQDSAPPVVLEQWQQGELSTHAAHQLTTAPKPIVQALHDAKLTTPEAQLVLKDPEMRARVESGEVSPRDAVSGLTALKDAHERHLKESGKKSLFALTAALTKLTDLSDATIEDALRAGFNYDLQDYLEKAEVKLSVLRAGLEGVAGYQRGIKTITVEAKAVN